MQRGRAELIPISDIIFMVLHALLINVDRPLFLSSFTPDQPRRHGEHSAGMIVMVRLSGLRFASTSTAHAATSVASLSVSPVI